MIRILPACSFVLPCLNEAKTLREVLKEIQDLRPAFQDLEILVVDNGSEDQSSAVADQMGARVLHCPQRGYGAALRMGVNEARFDLLVCLDADYSYCPEDALKLLRELEHEGLDLVVGNRLQGQIESGAMPFLHRWVGTPSLSFLLNLLHNPNRLSSVRDCNGGLRVFRKTEFLKWNPQSTGMEFASEMIVRALRAKARYKELPVSYRRTHPGRRPHLQPFRDGLRHVGQILKVAFESTSSK